MLRHGPSMAKPQTTLEMATSFRAWIDANPTALYHAVTSQDSIADLPRKACLSLIYKHSVELMESVTKQPRLESVHKSQPDEELLEYGS